MEATTYIMVIIIAAIFSFLVFFLVKRILKLVSLKSGGWEIINKYYNVEAIPQGNLIINPYIMVGKINYRNMVDFIFNEDGFGIEIRRKNSELKPIFIPYKMIERVIEKNRGIYHIFEIYPKMPEFGVIVINKFTFEKIKNYIKG